MNYKANTIRWKKNDIVIHDADAKEYRMLMVVIGYNRKNGLCKTRYIDQTVSNKTYENEIRPLHDPGRFRLKNTCGDGGRQPYGEIVVSELHGRICQQSWDYKQYPGQADQQKESDDMK